jgi:hypothetical protein
MSESGELTDSMDFNVAVGLLSTETAGGLRHGAVSIQLILQRALARVELKIPASGQGAFILAGNVHDALVAISKVLQLASKDVLIVDPYLDENASQNLLS